MKTSIDRLLHLLILIVLILNLVVSAASFIRNGIIIQNQEALLERLHQKYDKPQVRQQ